MASYGTFGTANLVSYVHEVGASTSQLLYHEEVLSAQHGAISCRFRHQQGKAMRVGGTIYFDDLRTYSSDVDKVASARSASVLDMPARRTHCNKVCTASSRISSSP